MVTVHVFVSKIRAFRPITHYSTCSNFLVFFHNIKNTKTLKNNKMKTNSELQKDVQDAIKWEPLLNAAEIGVTAKDGVVSLA